MNGGGLSFFMNRPDTAFTVASSLDYWDDDEYWEEEEQTVPADTHAVFWKFGLLSLPDCAIAANSLTFLDCRYNKIKMLPADLACIAQLQHLDLTGNSLEHLPSTLGILTNLRGLFLARNGIRALPESFGDLSALEAARFDHNLLIELPFQVPLALQ